MDKEKLFDFFAGVFNQDVYEDYPAGWEAAVQDFKTGATKEYISELITSIEEWMNGIQDDLELQKALHGEMGCAIGPEKASDVRAFIQEIITELRK